MKLPELNHTGIASLARQAVRIFFVSLLLALPTGEMFAQDAQPAASGQAATNYDDLITQGRALLKAGKFLEANSTAMQAAQADPNRYEAYLIAATAQSKSGRLEQAKNYMDMALQRVPADKKEKLQQIAGQMDQPQATASSPSELKRKLDVLKLVIADADNAQNPTDRYNRLQEFLQKSDDFLKANPDVTAVWAMRGAIALELNDAHVGWEAGHKLVALKAETVGGAKIDALMVKLDREGCLADEDPVIRKLLSQVCGTWRFFQPSVPPGISSVADTSWRGEIIISEVKSGILEVAGNFDYNYKQDNCFPNRNQINTHVFGSIQGAGKPKLVRANLDYAAPIFAGALGYAIESEIGCNITVDQKTEEGSLSIDRIIIDKLVLQARDYNILGSKNECDMVSSNGKTCFCLYFKRP